MGEMENTTGMSTKQSLFDRIAIGGHRKMPVFLLVIGMFTILPAVQGYNDGSRMATIQSLVEHHTFVIEQSDFIDVHDKVFIHGHFYSDKPPITALIGAVVYFPLYYLGITLGNGWNLAYYLITLFTVKLFWYLGIKAFYAILKQVEIEEKYRLVLTVALGLGSLYFSWSATFTNHVFSASFLVIGFYYFLKAKASLRIGTQLFLAGLFISLAGAQDYANLAFYAAFALVLLWQPYTLKQKAFFFLPAFLTIVPNFAILYAISGSIVPFDLVQEYFNYPGSKLAESGLLTGMEVKTGWSLAKYAFHMLIGKKGFFLHNPLTFLAIPFMIKEITARRKFWQEAVAIAAASLVIMVFYILTSKDYSGFAYSIRWFVPFLPLWYLFLYPIFTQERPKLRKAFSVLFILSVVIASVGLIDPWTTVITGVPFLDNLITVILRV